MMTKSPVSTCGAKVGLCLPRSRIAVWLGGRPRTTSVASITCHVRSTSPGLGVYVRTGVSFRQRYLGYASPRFRSTDRAAWFRASTPRVAQPLQCRGGPEAGQIAAERAAYHL